MAYTTIDLPNYKRGDSRPIVFLITSSDGSTPEDLTSWANAVMAVNSSKTPTDVSTEQFKVTGVFDADRTTGLISFTPLITDTDLDPGTYFYDVQVEDADGETWTFATGKFPLVQDIAKD